MPINVKSCFHVDFRTLFSPGPYFFRTLFLFRATLGSGGGPAGLISVAYSFPQLILIWSHPRCSAQPAQGRFPQLIFPQLIFPQLIFASGLYANTSSCARSPDA